MALAERQTLVIGRGKLGDALRASDLPPGFVWASGKHDMQGIPYDEVAAAFTVAYESALAAISEGSTHLVFIGSLASFRVLSRAPGYVIGHHGMVGVMRYLAVEYAGKVCVNMVCPGNIDGGMACTKREDEDLSERTQKKIATRTLDRWVKTEEVVEAVRFCLNCPPAVTGNTIHVDGGRSIWEGY